ncbi:MAG TPA: NAD(P)-dependent alcohol dehydrogenase [Anaeromyxobacter sp.]|nr:NAD(P)-dependent alcohol dehydrogenase [Anaeromyxobacter sp.]
MRALAYDRYGSSRNLELREIPTPRPGPGEVLVRVRAAALNPKDVFTMKGRFRRLSGRRFPKVIGLDLAGEVLAAGPGVVSPRPGDRVFGFLSGFRALRGSVAEAVAVPVRWVAAMPVRASFEEAAALALAGSTALQALRDLAHLHPGDRLLVNGASGGVGAAAIQLGRILGAEVTALASAGRLDLCRSLGAGEALDYAAGAPLDGDHRFRVVFDVFGNLSYAAARPALPRGGVFVTTVPSRRIVLDALRTAIGPVRARMVSVKPRTADLETLARHLDLGVLHPQIDRVFPLAGAAEAVRHLERRRAHGKVVVRFD